MREKMRRERMGIEPTHRLLGGAQDLKSWEGTSPQPLPSPSSENYRKLKIAQALAAVKRNDNTAERKSVADPTARFPPMTSLQVRAFALPYNRG
jgi:hypothetical protein